jgi:uncharacterized protein YkwD
MKRFLIGILIFALLGGTVAFAATTPISPITDAKWAQISVDSTGMGDPMWLTDKGYLQTDATPRIIDGRLFVLFRWATEIFGGSATWASREDGTTSLVTLYAPIAPPPPPPVVITNTITVTITQTVTVYVSPPILPHPTPLFEIPTGTLTVNDPNNYLQIFSLVNWQRAQRGLSQLTLIPELSNIATAHSCQEVIDLRAGLPVPNHYGYEDRVAQAVWYGYTAIGENSLLLANHWDQELAIVNLWMANPIDAANLFAPDAKYIGVCTWIGERVSGEGLLWIPTVLIAK